MNPWWEARLLRFLEVLDVGCVVDEEENWATWSDGRIGGKGRGVATSFQWFS